MIKVDFPEPTENLEWAAWRTDCITARQSLIEEFERIDVINVNNDLYKKMKTLLFDASFGKCAFCETRVAYTDQHGDVEHFRPKKGVTDEYDQPIIITLRDGTKRKHPGYYWLAYDWLNLLPACGLCNQPNISRDGRRVGKRNRFPVYGEHGHAPDSEASESPIFIHPFLEDPVAHFDIELSSGVIFGLTDRGKKCVDIFDLNRDGLVDNRRNLHKELKRLWNDVYRATTQLPTSIVSNDDLDDLLNHKNGKKAYTLVARKTFRELRDRQNLLDAIVDA